MNKLTTSGDDLPSTKMPLVRSDELPGGKAKPQATDEQLRFLQGLARWAGAATARELGPQTTQAENSARQTCKRRGWATYDGGYWRLTEAGHAVLQST